MSIPFKGAVHFVHRRPRNVEVTSAPKLHCPTFYMIDAAMADPATARSHPRLVNHSHEKAMKDDRNKKINERETDLFSLKSGSELQQQIDDALVREGILRSRKRRL